MATDLGMKNSQIFNSGENYIEIPHTATPEEFGDIVNEGLTNKEQWETIRHNNLGLLYKFDMRNVAQEYVDLVTQPTHFLEKGHPEQNIQLIIDCNKNLQFFGLPRLSTLLDERTKLLNKLFEEQLKRQYTAMKREAAKLAKRLDEAKEAARAKAAKTMRATGPAGAATATATATATNFKVEEKPKDVSAPAPEGAADERADASTRSDVGADVEDTAVISASTSSDETEATDAAVRVVSVNERSFETPESEAPVAPTPTVSHDVEPIVERHHADGEAYDVIAEHPKLVRAIHEANALVHKAHARRVESNQEFQDALRYREQVVHMASELGIPVAPLREVKETFKQSTYEAPLGPGAGEKAAEAAKSALAATKKFVDFAAPHVRSATTKAFDYSKQHATTAAGKLKQAHAKGDIRAPTLDEATDFAKSTSRRALGACVHAFDAITDQFAAVANKSAVKPQKS